MSGKTTRRAVILGGAAAAAAWGADRWFGARAYGAAEAWLRAPLPDAPSLQDLVRYATLAPNGHNTQPWRFRAEGDALAISPDLSRRTPVVDPDDHHLWASLGCAAETLSLAARARGMAGAVDFAGDRVAVSLTPGVADETPRFRAIPHRQCTRSLYDGTPISPDLAELLIGVARAAGADALWIDDPARIDGLLALVTVGNTRQIEDPAFVAELKAWVRFNTGSAARHGDGLFSACTGNPSLPDWAGRLVFDSAFRAGPENDKIAAQVRSSAGFLVIVAPEDAPPGWVAAGRAAQAVMLQATVEGLRCAFLNQATEVPEMRSDLRSLLGLGEMRPSLILRLGRAPAMPYALRRPVAEVMA